MKGIWTIAALALFCLAPISAQGQTLPDAAGDQPALITADEIVYDEKAGIVTARGSVEISQSGRVLMADSVSYNTKTDVVSATGNVAILEKSGDVMFADYAEVTGDLREGFVRDIRILLSDNSRMAANSGTRSAGNITELDHAVYSPCELCREDPTRAPLWQIKAKKVVHDQEAKTITYRDASMEFFGIPILYLPYFQHPDPTVKRQSGFLLPSLQSSDQIGQLVQFPYFLVLSDTADVTLSPGFATKQSFVMGADYRQIFPKGALNLSGTGTIADYDNGTTVESDQFRWYVAGDGRVDLSSTFRAGFDLARTSDDTFMRVYSFGSPATMTSDAYVEGLRGRSYFRAETIAYQGLRATDVDGEIPIVLPSIAYQYVSDPGRYGGFWTIDGGLLSLLRTDGRDVRRASAAAQWVLPYTTRSGQVYKLTARLQADGYWATDYNPSLPDDVSPVAGEEVFSGRIFPELALEWRYPMIRPGTRFSQTIEPIVQLRLAPNGANSDDIPNEDSTDLEFDIANLFTLNRFAGNDRVDPGPRLDYGFKWTAVGSNGGYTSVFLGQSFRFTDPGDLFIGGSGLEDRLSDIVGQVEFHPIAMASLSYRFQIDPDDFNFRRNELSLDIGPPLLNFRLDYISIDGQAYSGGGVGSVQREEFYGRASSQFTENWSAFASVRYDLSAERTLDERYGLRYNDECFLIEGVLERRHYTDRELEPDNVFFLRVALSNLGEITD